MLLYRLQPHCDECPVSYLIRVAEHNGFKHIGHLLNYAGLNWKNNRAPIHQILTGEFNLSPYLSVLDLPASESPLTDNSRCFRRVIDTPYLLVKSPKVCPDCIQETGYCCANWAYLPVLACTKHNRLLVDTFLETGERLSWYRQHLAAVDHARSDNCQSPQLKRLLAIARYINGLIASNKPDHSIPAILDGLTLREALTLLHYLAHYHSRLQGEVFKPLVLDNQTLAQHYLDIWQMLQDWPDSFYTMLSQYIDKPMSQRGVAGINKHFRDLYERLHRQRDNAGIARIKTAFDQYIHAQWPGLLSPGRTTRIQPSTKARQTISKKEAARILNCRPERINRLTQQQQLTPQIFKGKTCYNREQVVELAQCLLENWSMADTCKALQISRYQLKRLLDAGIIPVIQKPGPLNRNWLIDKAGCQQWVNKLCSYASPEKPSGHTLTMAAITRQGFSIVQLVAAMQMGQVTFTIKAIANYPYSLKQCVNFQLTSPA